MSEPALQSENNAIFNQNYAINLFILVKFHVLAILVLGDI